MSLDAARAVADAVLYEGYLLYPYRASAAKNRSRWQFGVLGPPSAGAEAFGEAPDLAMQCLLRPGGRPAVTILLRFLQLQVREVQRREPDGSHTPAAALTVAGSPVLSWDEAVEREITLCDVPLTGRAEFPIAVPGGAEEEPLAEPGGTVVGRIVRRREPLTARLTTAAEPDGGLLRLTVAVANEHPARVAGKDAAVRRSLLGTHLLLEARDAAFVSLLDPPPGAAAAAARCRQHRCWPALAGPHGSSDVLLGAPIILEDHPRLAEQSPGPLFDLCEIDEILTLRVMTMTEAEKAEARATDPRAREIVERCDALTPADLQRLHGAWHDAEPAGDVPWWDPAADAAVDPATDTAVVGGVRIARGSLVRLRPSRRADAQDVFLAGRVARVTAVLSDVDGEVHVAVVPVDDPAADLHDWYGRYYYFAPDELEPLAAAEPAAASVLVAGVGNVFLGDDGFGPEVARRLTAEGGLPPGVRVTDYGIRGMHLAYDLLAGYDALVLVDALPADGPPGEVVVLEMDPADDPSGQVDAHRMDPVTVLGAVTRLGGRLPAAYLVGCRAATVAEGIGLSPVVAAAVPEAITATRTLLDRVRGTAGPGS